MKSFTLMTLLCLFFTGACLAGDADDVRAAVTKLDEAFVAGDVETIAKYFHADHSRFFPTGLLIEGFDKQELKDLYEAGLTISLATRHLNVKVFGNCAVATGYNEGRITMPNGSFNDQTTRFTEVWVKDGSWKRVHIHASELEGSEDD